ncbi:MAG: hypothetical protein ACSHWS_01870 [Sulfitobacter sp.]
MMDLSSNPRIFVSASQGLERQSADFIELLSNTFQVVPGSTLDMIKLEEQDAMLLMTDDAFFASFSSKGGTDEQLIESIPILLRQDENALLWVHDGDVRPFLDASLPDQIQPLFERKVLQFPDRVETPRIDFERDVLPFIRRMTSAFLIDAVSVIDFVTNHPQNPLSHMGQARSLLENMQRELAAKDLNEFDVKARQLLMAQAHFVLGQYDEALAILKGMELHLHDEDDPLLQHAVRFYIGWCELRKGDTSQALRTFEDLLKSDEDTVRAASMVLMAEIAVEAGNLERADDWLDKVTEVKGATSDILLSRLRVAAMIAHHAGDTPRLAQISEQAKKILESGEIPADSYNRHRFESEMAKSVEDWQDIRSAEKRADAPFNAAAAAGVDLWARFIGGMGQLFDWLSTQVQKAAFGRPQRPVGRFTIAVLVLLPLALGAGALMMHKVSIYNAAADGNLTAGYDPGSAYASAITAHKGAVTSIDVSADGSLVVSGGTDGMVRLWNVDGALVIEAPAPFSAIQAVEFAQLPDEEGEFIAVFSKPPVFEVRQMSARSGEVEGNELLRPDAHYILEDQVQGVRIEGPDVSWVALRLTDLKPVEQDAENAALDVQSIVEGFGELGLVEVPEEFISATTFDGEGTLGLVSRSEFNLIRLSSSGDTFIEESLGVLQSNVKLMTAGNNGDYIFIYEEGQGLVVTTSPGDSPRIEARRPLLGLASSGSRTLPIDLVEIPDLFAVGLATWTDSQNTIGAVFGDDPDPNMLAVLNSEGTLSTVKMSSGEIDQSVQLKAPSVRLGNMLNQRLLVALEQELTIVDSQTLDVIVSAISPRAFTNPIAAGDGTVYAIADDRESLIIWRGNSKDSDLSVSTSRFADRIVAIEPIPGSNQLAALGINGDLVVLNVYEGGEVVAKQTAFDGRRPVDFAVLGNTRFLVANADGTFLSYAQVTQDDSSIQVAAPSELVGSRIFLPERPLPVAIEVSPNQQILAVLDEQLSLSLYDLEADAPELIAVAQFSEKGSGSATSPILDFSSDGRFLAVSGENNTLRAFSMTAIADEVTNRKNRQSGSVVCGNCLAVGLADGQADLEDGSARETNLFTLDGEGHVKRWDYRTTMSDTEQDQGYSLDGSPIFVRRLGQWGNSVYGIAYADGRVDIRNFGTSERIGTLIEGMSAPVTAVDGTAEGDLVIIGTAAGGLRFVRPNLHRNLKRYDVLHSLHRWIDRF